VKAGCGKTARPVWAADGGKPKNGASSDPTPMAWKLSGRKGGEPTSKGPAAGKVKSGITLFWEELWEILRDHQPYQRNSRELQNKLRESAGQQSYASSGVKPAW
jgi:hypothetical protein